MDKPKIEFYMKDPEAGRRFFHALEDLLLFIRVDEKRVEQAFPFIHLQYQKTVDALHEMYTSELGTKTKRQSGKTRRH